MHMHMYMYMHMHMLQIIASAPTWCCRRSRSRSRRRPTRRRAWYPHVRSCVNMLFLSRLKSLRLQGGSWSGSSSNHQSHCIALSLDDSSVTLLSPLTYLLWGTIVYLTFAPCMQHFMLQVNPYSPSGSVFRGSRFHGEAVRLWRFQGSKVPVPCVRW